MSLSPGLRPVARRRRTGEARGSISVFLVLGQRRQVRVAPLDFSYVINRLAIGRDVVAVFLDGAFARVIAGKRQTDIAVERVQQEAQISRSGVNVLFRIEDVSDAESGRGLR